MPARSIMKLLTPPSKVAHALDWRKVSGSVLSMTVVKDKIEMAVASHPSFEEPVEQLPSITLETVTVDNHKVLKPSVVEKLSNVVNEHHVCGMLVSWPVQKEGWCGASCGRVLHTLDQLTEQSSPLMSSSRPICLWDEEHNLPSEDEWGRASVYSKSNADKTLHQASTEQYGDHGNVAVDVWNDFVRTHWPDIYMEQQEERAARQQERISSPSSTKVAFIDIPKDDQFMTQTMQ